MGEVFFEKKLFRIVGVFQFSSGHFMFCKKTYYKGITNSTEFLVFRIFRDHLHLLETKTLSLQHQHTRVMRNSNSTLFQEMCKSVSENDITTAQISYKKFVGDKEMSKRLTRKMKDIDKLTIVVLVLYSLDEDKRVKRRLKKMRADDEIRVKATIERVFNARRQDHKWALNDRRWEILIHILHEHWQYMPSRQCIYELMKVYRHVARRMEKTKKGDQQQLEKKVEMIRTELDESETASPELDSDVDEE